MQVEPIGAGRQALVRRATEAYLRLAERIFDRRLDRIPVQFDLSGGTAGMFRVDGHDLLIRYNPWIFAKYFEENLFGTVPHEVAHYVVHEVYPRRGTRPHGREWRDLMDCFGADSGVTFDLDLEGVPQRRQRTHRYACDCRIHDISSTRHNRVQRGRGRYQCVSCQSELIYTPA